MFTLLRFNVRFFQARRKEMKGDFLGAVTLLDRDDVPARWRSLNDAYRLRMLVLGSPTDFGPSIVKSAESFSWYQAPASPGDRFAREYCDCMRAGVTGDLPARLESERKLKRMKVRAIYRNSLFVP